MLDHFVRAFRDQPRNLEKVFRFFVEVDFGLLKGPQRIGELQSHKVLDRYLPRKRNLHFVTVLAAKALYRDPTPCSYFVRHRFGRRNQSEYVFSYSDDVTKVTWTTAVQVEIISGIAPLSGAWSYSNNDLNRFRV